MQPFKNFSGTLVPLPIANVDTDQIIPKQYLKSILRTGFGEVLFDDWRYLEPGEPGQDHSLRAINPNFVLNKAEYAGASILLTEANFGCGSSREHAPWALQQFGFRCIIAPSFADIFFNNSFKNGLLCVVLTEQQIAHLFATEQQQVPLQLTINLEQQQVKIANHPAQSFDFQIDSFRKKCLLEGLDDIALTLAEADKIKAYEAQRKVQAPWLFRDGSTFENSGALSGEGQ